MGGAARLLAAGLLLAMAAAASVARQGAARGSGSLRLRMVERAASLDDPDDPPPRDEHLVGEDAVQAKEYSEYWKGIDWQSSDECKQSHNHPAATAAEIEATCKTAKQGATANYCACMVAKSHSCYVYCRNHLFKGEEDHWKWQKCMANCYPSPTCKDMCQGGEVGCEDKCIERYSVVVEPFKRMYADSNTTVEDYSR
eukprot:gnl/TRDRNA2_/TRDRNA2_179430_c0_seq1.p1 gnl/TRDRNA2_/TRDRNA2_179430_c0~~gnl/TRDRNA2_/TRDRNA2_179430_c0_seq1.p1  ORF type:complete len:225 (-),score=21.19 gnl/TRDRNA2_/TRDRNA2_179430_c0_seq1:66-659(-)